MAVKLPSAYPSLPKSQANDWVRPADWPTITNDPNEINLLVNDQGVGYISLNATFTGTAYVDWGDGSSPQAITSGTPFTKYYTEGTGTPCSRGYTTFVIRVYGATQFTTCRPTYTTATNSNGTTLGQRYSIGILEFYYGDNVQQIGGSYFSSNGGGNSVYSFNQLEYVKFPATCSLFAIPYMFVNCYALERVDLPYYTGVSSISMVNTFSGCVNLRSITFPSNFPISDLSSTFSGCASLKSVIFNQSSLPNITTSFTTTFANCVNLVSISLPTMANVTSFSSTFTNCYNLRYFKLANGSMVFGTTTAITFDNAFNGCGSLEQVILPSTVNTTFLASYAFQYCYSLKNITFPASWVFTNITNMFTNCYSLQRVEFKSPSVPTFITQAAFQNCESLVEVILPTSVTTPGVSVSMFSGCSSLGTFSTTLNFTQANLMFQNCENLKSVSMPNATSINQANSMFIACYNLIEVILPSSLPSCSRFDSMFSSCYKIETITFPNTPSTASGTFAFGQMFRNCYSLRSITFGTFGTRTYANQQFWANMFDGCHSLESIDLSSFNTMTFNNDGASTQIFANCGKLKTVKFGIPLSSTGTSTFTLAACIQNSQSVTDFDATGVLASSTSFHTWTNTTTATIVGSLQSATFSCKFSVFRNNGISGTTFNLQNLRLLNSATGQYLGTSPQIDVSYTMMGQAALVQLFNDLPTVTAKTINITAAAGASSLTAGERAIATGKGWTITG